MKRDIDLIKELLILIEKSANELSTQIIELDGFTENEIFYNVGLLISAGLVSGKETSTKDSRSYHFLSLTWEGHDFLDAIRTNVGWKAIKKEVKKQGTSLPFSVLKAIAIEAVKGVVGL